MKNQVAGRILAIDYGRKRVGLAISDPLRVIATPYGYLPRKLAKDPTAQDLIEKIHKICVTEEVSELLLGEPRRTDGQVGEMLSEIRDFGRALAEKTGLELHYFDERYTTLIAEQSFIKGEGVLNRREQIDARAAAVLLSDYLRHCDIIGETVSGADSKESEAR